MFDDMPISDLVSPQFCVGGTLDIPTASFILGQNGEMVMNSGLGAINSVAGPENSYKTALALTLTAIVHDRHMGMPEGGDPLSAIGISENVYETEGSLSYTRIEGIHSHFNNLSQIDIYSSEALRKQLRLTPSSKIWLDHYFEKLVGAAKERGKAAASGKGMFTTPFIGTDGNLIKMMAPVINTIDTLTEAKVSTMQEGVVAKELIGDSKTNMLGMSDARAKTQLISNLAHTANRGGTQGNMMFMLTAHVSPKHQMDPYAPAEQKLTFSRRGAGVKGTSKKFEFINNNLFEIHNAAMLYNSSSDKTSKYPLDDSDRTEGTVDLMRINMVNTRNKNGPAGFHFNLLISQTEGFLPALTDFYYCKEVCRSKDGVGFGISGNDRSYSFDLYPDTKLSRTTVRGQLDGDALLARAVEITTHMAQMQRHWHLDPKYIVSPGELRDSLTKKGYDWNVLLDTRCWWTFKEFEKFVRQPYLSTMDLLRMHTDEYHPYWLPKKAK